MPLSHQSCVDWNRDVLKRELGLEEEDIIDLPILFKLVQEKDMLRAVAYYPDMVCQGSVCSKLWPRPPNPKVVDVTLVLCACLRRST